MSIYIWTKEVNELYKWEKTIVISDMKWPCPDGFHVPTQSEISWLLSSMSTLWYRSYDWFKTYLKFPTAWYYSQWGEIVNRDIIMMYWTCTASWNYSISLQIINDNRIYTNSDVRCHWNSIRPFKDEYVTPTSSRTTLLTVWSWWIYRDQTNWLISITTNWTTWYTIADKNAWATKVYNSWDTLSEDNCWKYYQRWNDYWFPFSWSVTTSSTTVNASTYWPWNYYESSTFITWNNPRDSSNNTNLRWWVSQWTSTRTEPKPIKEAYIWDTKVFPPVRYTLLAEVIISWDNRVYDGWRYLLDHWRYVNYDSLPYDKLLYEIKNYRSNSSRGTFRCYVWWYSSQYNETLWTSRELFQYLAEWVRGTTYNSWALWFNNSSWQWYYSWEYRVYWVS